MAFSRAPKGKKSKRPYGGPKNVLYIQRARRRITIMKAPSIHKFIQIVETPNVSTINNAVGFSSYAFVFRLDQCNQVATFSALFDQYRIDMVEITFLPRAMHNLAAGSGFGAANSYYWLSAVDHDDATVPAALSTLREYGNCKTHSATKGDVVKIMVKPRVADILFNNGVTSSYGARISPWIDMAYTGTEHYGLKIAMPPSGAALTTVAYEVQVRYLLEMKDVR